MTTSAERAYQHIKAAILSGRHRGGTRLPEDMLASELELSRTPVRDAFRRLQSEGLVEIAPNLGARVASWTEGELGEISRMRIMLESFAAELAARKITGSALDELVRLADCMENATGRNGAADLDSIGKDNLAFHRVIVEAACNQRLSTAIEPLWHLPMVIRKFALFSPERLERSMMHHREIIAALKERDPDWAGATMRMHIHAARAYDRLLIDQAKDGSADDAATPG